MASTDISCPALCRHLRQGRCSREYWRIMRESGRNGLVEYACVLQLESPLPPRAEPEGPRLGSRVRPGGTFITCKSYRPDMSCNGRPCRYAFLEICLLHFPPCPGVCPHFLPPGDQKG